jgi:nucleoid-associated protein YgaU
MGIFDFVKDAGRKIGLGDDKAEEASETARDERLGELQQGNELLRLILEMDQGVKNPRVEFDDGVATIYGTAPSQAIKENTILVIGNVRGVSRVDDRMEVVEAAPEATFYTVTSGDTLGAIAKQHYGDASRYPEIFEANKPMLKDADLIYPGQVLRIPQG